jgi:hypothetical protein
MEADANDTNPFATDMDLLFVGREQADARLSPHLADPAHLGAVGFYGREHSGKTALLRHFQATAQPNRLMIYIGLDSDIVNDEATLLRALALSSLDATVRQGYLPGASRDMAEAEKFDDHRVWLRDVCLPQIYRAIRAHRRLVWLIDDAHHMLDALENEQIPANVFDFLRSLLNPQLAAVLTLDMRYEDKISQFAPLVETGSFHRLAKLSPEETARILEKYLAISGDAHTLIFQNTDSEPYLIQQMAKALYEQYGTRQIDTQAVRAVIPQVIDACRDEFDRRWNALSQDEQQALIAVANLHYERPLERIDPAAIEAWLVETDYPMDGTAIAAAMRSLEYAELIRHTEGSAHVAALLLQRWLLNRDQPQALQPAASYPQGVSAQNRRLVIIGVALIVALALILTLVLTSDQDNDTQPLPTVTLIDGQ